MDGEVVQGFNQLYMMVIAVGSFVGAMTTIIAFYLKLRFMRKEKEKEKKQEELERDKKYSEMYYSTHAIDGMAKRLEDLIDDELRDLKVELNENFTAIDKRIDHHIEKSENRIKAFSDREYVKKETGTGFYKDIEHLKLQITDAFSLYNKLRDKIKNGG